MTDTEKHEARFEVKADEKDEVLRRLVDLVERPEVVDWEIAKVEDDD